MRTGYTSENNYYVWKTHSSIVYDGFLVNWTDFHLTYLISDLDECKQLTFSKCQQNCRNKLGSFTCYCNNGFLLHSNKRNCTGKLNDILYASTGESLQLIEKHTLGQCLNNLSHEKNILNNISHRISENFLITFFRTSCRWLIRRSSGW